MLTNGLFYCGKPYHIYSGEFFSRLLTLTQMLLPPKERPGFSERSKNSCHQS